MQINEPKTDWFNFISTVVFILALTLALLLAPQSSQEIIKRVLSFVTGEIGMLYIWFGIVVLFFLLIIAISPFGRIKLGLQNDSPEHSTLSWIAMLFSTGIGTTILYWGRLNGLNTTRNPLMAYNLVQRMR